MDKQLPIQQSLQGALTKGGAPMPGYLINKRKPDGKMKVTDLNSWLKGWEGQVEIIVRRKV